MESTTEVIDRFVVLTREMMQFIAERGKPISSRDDFNEAVREWKQTGRASQ